MTDSMTSFERVQTVLAGRIPDRVPVGLHNFMMSAQASGLPFPIYFQDGEAMAEGAVKAWQEYQHDMIILENGTVALAQACGCQVEYLAGSVILSVAAGLVVAVAAYGFARFFLLRWRG